MISNKHLWTDDTDTVIADDPIDADKVWSYFTGEDRSLYVGEQQPWKMIPDDHLVSVFFEDEPDAADIPTGGLVEANDDQRVFDFKVIATAEAWVKHAGDNIDNGFLCSKEY